MRRITALFTEEENEALANASYTNMLMDAGSLVRVGRNLAGAAGTQFVRRLSRGRSAGVSITSASRGSASAIRVPGRLRQWLRASVVKTRSAETARLPASSLLFTR